MEILTVNALMNSVCTLYCDVPTVASFFMLQIL